MQRADLSRIALVTSVLAAAGCVSVGPTWSELSGGRFHRAVLDRQGLIIVRVDGESTPARIPIKIAPGTHEITVQSLPHGHFRGGYETQITIDLAPCKRYYINAQYPDPIQPRYTPVVDEIEPVAGCLNGL
ncbi:MAG: hypothetical protein M3Z31_13820 [Pseudomonadota bacterium]|nr:hypothetical protein [Pseudomonadota bacterium]